jgi:hypothetical protein
VFIKGLIGRPNRAIPAPFNCLASFMWRVWLPSSHLSTTSFHSFALLHPARLRVLNFYFPLPTGRLDSGMV